MKIGFVGVGNMGFPIMQGAISLFGAESVTFLTKRKEHMEELENKTGAVAAASLTELVRGSDIVVLCVKPQYVGELYAEIKQAMTKEKLIVSIMAGVSIDTLLKETNASRVIRTMPNTPAIRKEGMTCICYSDLVTEEDAELVKKLFLSVGKVEEIPETLMNAAILANGSSPAFAYIFMEALADAAVKYGIPRAMAYRLVGQTVLGSAKMVLESGKHPGELKDAVCSPGGTTIAGVAALEEYGLRNAVIKAADACYEKATKL